MYCDEDAIFACLKKVMAHDILDARGCAAVTTTKKGSPSPERQPMTAKSWPVWDDHPHRDAVGLIAEGTEFKQRLYALLEREDPELYDLVYAIFEENALMPREIAAVIGTDAADVQKERNVFALSWRSRTSWQLQREHPNEKAQQNVRKGPGVPGSG
jgi:hypothetical protein